jgi:acetylornithine/N-succinyldiaminopimelate aminotransferase
MREIDAPRRAVEMGAALTERLGRLPGVVDVRGKGLLLGVELGPDADAKNVVAALLDRGLVANAVTATAVRLAPPLTVSLAEIDEAVAIFAEVVK